MTIPKKLCVIIMAAFAMSLLPAYSGPTKTITKLLGGSSVSKPIKKFVTPAKRPDYTVIKDPKNVLKSTKPTPRQVREMKKVNMKANNGVLRDDLTGEVMVPSKKSVRGITPAANEAQVDHIKPVLKGGTRHMKNLQLITRKNNRTKWFKL